MVPSPFRGMQDVNASRLSVLVDVIGGILGGYVSFILGGLPASAAGLLLTLAIGYGVAMALGKKEWKWWMGNGGTISLFAWLLAWAWLLNA